MIFFMVMLSGGLFGKVPILIVHPIWHSLRLTYPSLLDVASEPSSRPCVLLQHWNEQTKRIPLRGDKRFLCLRTKIDDFIFQSLVQVRLEV